MTVNSSEKRGRARRVAALTAMLLVAALRRRRADDAIPRQPGDRLR